MERSLRLLPLTVAFPLLFGAATPVAAQFAWGQRTTQVTPSARVYHVLVHDPRRGRTVMFGGYQDVVNNWNRNDTWEWDGDEWRQCFPATSPPARHGAMACFDEVRGTVIMFGGEYHAQNMLNDTWEWNGVDWRLLAMGGPAGRSSGGMAFDYANGRTVLFGGFSLPGVMVHDMWEFTNGAWQNRAAQPLPPAGGSFLFCSDPRRGEIVCQGGWTGSSTLNACWVWNGAQWSPANTRGSYDMSGAAYDPIRRRIVAFGGGAGQPPSSAETWEWDGINWIQRLPSLSPPSRGGCRLAFDTVSGRMLLFGGDRGSANNLADTWEYFHFTPASYQNYGQGCAGTNLQVPRLDTVDELLPWVGEAWSLEVTGIPGSVFNIPFGLIGKSRTSANGLPLPFDLGVIGMPGCFLLMSGSQSTTVLPSQAGRALWDITFPLDLRMVGQDFFLQAAVLDPGANALGVTVSNAGHARPGLK